MVKVLENKSYEEWLRELYLTNRKGGSGEILLLSITTSELVVVR